MSNQSESSDVQELDGNGSASGNEEDANQAESQLHSMVLGNEDMMENGFLDSDDGDNDSTTSLVESHSEDELPDPREHSYLVGASHPLIAEDFGTLRKRPRNQTHEQTRNHNLNNPFVDLCILELHGVVLFPGMTIPIRLRDRAWIQYLGRQIDRCRTAPHKQPHVRFGILTSEPPEIQRGSASRLSRLQQRSRGSWMRTPISASQRSSFSSLLLSDEFIQDEEQSEPKHPFTGRVGTIATIKYTHEYSSETLGSSILSDQVWRRSEEENELVITAIGTSRFQVLSCLRLEETPGLDVFQVEEWNDDPLPLPPLGRSLLSQPRSEEEMQNANSRLVRIDRLVWNLAIVTPIPYFVYQMVWPWRIVEQIVEILKSNTDKNNLYLPSLGDIGDSVLEPTAFSFWIASNWPLTEEEKLKILRSRSAVERLRIIYEKVREYAQNQCFVCCKACDTKLATVTSVFTVGGAEGATSNYGKSKCQQRYV